MIDFGEKLGELIAEAEKIKNEKYKAIVLSALKVAQNDILYEGIDTWPHE